MTTQPTHTSSLADKLNELISAGLVTPMPLPSSNDFPTARVVLPVYDSTGVGAPTLNQGGANGRLARVTERA